LTRDTKPERHVLRCAAPGVLLAALCLLPFLNKAFTIDDPYFLAEARQTLITPLTPAAVAICWDNAAHKRPLREIGSNAALMGYVLAPVILLGSREWAGHLTILLFLAAAVIATVSLAFRCGADPRQAMLAGLIFASTPVVLGMAGTVLPDIPVTALGVLGMERLLAWKEERKIHQAVVAGVALGLAPLGRSHTLLLLPIGALILASGALWPPSLRKLRAMGLVHWLPIILAGCCFVFFTWITFVPSPSALLPGAPNPEQLGGLHNVRHNLPALGIDWLLTTAIGIVWLIRGGWRGTLALAAILLAGQIARYGLDYDLATVLSVGLAGLVALGFVLVETWRSGRPVLFWLAVWLLIPLPILPYIHFPAKYLAPCAPAAAILIAWTLSRLTTTRLAMVSSVVICAGVAFGVAILKADAALAGSARHVIAEEIAPHTRAGGQAWYFGQWALHWYAEKAGADCLTTDPPYPHKGDLLISDEIDGGDYFLQNLPGFPRHLIRTVTIGEPGGRVVSPAAGAGFFSNAFGYWPWLWSDAPINTYHVWVLE